MGELDSLIIIYEIRIITRILIILVLISVGSYTIINEMVVITAIPNLYK
jgi:hypothetical protein